MPLREIAHARAGDKGDTSNVVGVRLRSGALCGDQGAADGGAGESRIRRLIRGNVSRYELDHLHALNFVLHEALEGGVNQSLNLDAHGKSWSFLLLGLEVEIEE